VDLFLGGVFILAIAAPRCRYFSIGLLLGVCWGGVGFIYAAWQVSYDPSWLNQRVSLQGQVVSIQQQGASRRLRLTDVTRDDGVALHGMIDLYQWSKRAPVQEGQSIHAVVKLHAPRNHQNPGGFDYEGYCFDHHIVLIGSLKGAFQLLSEDRSWLDQLRTKVRAVLPENRAQRGVLQALLLADRSMIPVPVQDAFAATGAAHLLAISGLHVGMLALWCGFLTFWLLTRREAWIVQLSVSRWAMSMGVLAAVGYATLANWPLPTQRAALMLAAAALAWWLRARYQPVNILLAALMLILLLDSQAVTSVSLWLSFVATLALLLFVGHESQKASPVWQYLKGLCMVSVVAGLATLPLIVAVFERLPAWSLVVNLLLVPLYGLLVLPLAFTGEMLALLGLPQLALWAMDGAGALIDLGNALLLQIHHWPGGNLWVPHHSIGWALFYSFGMLITSILLIRQRHKVWLIFMGLVLSVYVGVMLCETEQKAVAWTVWDVGQGAAASLIQPTASGAHVFVVDVPGRKGSRWNGGTTVASGLRAQGVTHVDVLMLSHAQADHAGGALRLMDSLRTVSELWLADVPANHAYATMREAVRRVHHAGGKVRWLKQGDQLPLGNMTLRVLWPPKGYAPSNDNNTSLVCSIEGKGQRQMLISGDMEAPVEQALLHEKLLLPYSTILIPHHGSRTSSTPSFVQHVQPHDAIAQTGYQNHFGFPKKEVIERYQHVGAKIWDTATGAVIWFPLQKKEAVVQFSQGFGKKRDAALQWVRLFL